MWVNLGLVSALGLSSSGLRLRSSCEEDEGSHVVAADEVGPEEALQQLLHHGLVVLRGEVQTHQHLVEVPQPLDLCPLHTPGGPSGTRTTRTVRDQDRYGLY